MNLLILVGVGKIRIAEPGGGFAREEEGNPSAVDLSGK
jgi:hypothetical protein